MLLLLEAVPWAAHSPKHQAPSTKREQDDDDNGFGTTVRFAPVVTKVRYRKKI
jgi:hypothetical protein